MLIEMEAYSTRMITFSTLKEGQTEDMTCPREAVDKLGAATAGAWSPWLSSLVLDEGAADWLTSAL